MGRDRGFGGRHRSNRAGHSGASPAARTAPQASLAALLIAPRVVSRNRISGRPQRSHRPMLFRLVDQESIAACLTTCEMDVCKNSEQRKRSGPD